MREAPETVEDRGCSARATPVLVVLDMSRAFSIATMLGRMSWAWWVVGAARIIIIVTGSRGDAPVSDPRYPSPGDAPPTKCSTVSRRIASIL